MVAQGIYSKTGVPQYSYILKVVPAGWELEIAFTGFPRQKTLLARFTQVFK